MNFLLILLFLEGCSSITVVDSRRNFDTRPVKNVSRLVARTRASLGRLGERSLLEVRSHPVSASLTLSCLVLSLLSPSPPASGVGFHKIFDNLLTLFFLQRMDGHSLLSLLSFYWTVRSLEARYGAREAVKMLALNAFVSVLPTISPSSSLLTRPTTTSPTWAALDKVLVKVHSELRRVSFNKFAKSVLLFSCLLRPGEASRVLNLFIVPNRLMPVVAMAADYLLTLDENSLYSSLSTVMTSLMAFSVYPYFKSNNSQH